MCSRNVNVISIADCIPINLSIREQSLSRIRSKVIVSNDFCLQTI